MGNENVPDRPQFFSCIVRVKRKKPLLKSHDDEKLPKRSNQISVYINLR